MRVVGVGFGRTGTSSMRHALERLGFGPCYHMFVVVGEPRRARGWLDAMQGSPDWPAVFDGFGSTVDWPAAAHWRELIDAYPDARVVLTVRDPQKWYDSMTRTIFQGAEAWQRPVVRALIRALAYGIGRPDLWDLARVVNDAVNQRVFDGRYDREHAVEVFERHVADVRAAVPPERLLVFEVAQGWEPLCGFLDVPVPDEPFPHANDAGQFRRWRARTAARALGPPLVVAGLAVAAAVVVGRRLSR